MWNQKKIYMGLVSILFTSFFSSAQVSKGVKNREVNVFLGSSGDHGQMSPAASYPFSMLSIGPQTYPKLHAGYEYEAKRFLGFTHNRFEGVGCQGSGGNLLIRPFYGKDFRAELIKVSQSGEPGYYEVSFNNRLSAEFSVYKNSGMHRYRIRDADSIGFYIDFAHTLNNKFVAERHIVNENKISGWIEAKTTCNVGTYKIYYTLHFDAKIQVRNLSSHEIIVSSVDKHQVVEIRVGMSSVSTDYANASIPGISFEQLKLKASLGWQNQLQTLMVEGDEYRKKLFYSLFYRTLQSPYQISEPDGVFRATNGQLKKSSEVFYNGWAIWDNYRTQLPLLSIVSPDQYRGMVTSIAQLYSSGKKDYATQTEPTNTVRTEHASVVLLDSYRKGYPVNFTNIIDSLVRDVDRLDFSKPDKALESSYDTWALSEIFKILNNPEMSTKYRLKALEYKQYWRKDFEDMTKKDVDKVQARDLYQGTIWQYRWFVPFDNAGLIKLMGGERSYLQQLDYFFDSDLYNHANEPDLQVPAMYNATSQPWKSQALIHKLATDTVIQYYFNNNNRGIGPFVDRIYKNEPKAYIPTMDDDAGAMSAWYVFSALGFMPACPGWPVYYLHAPLFKSISIKLPGNKMFKVVADNYHSDYRYISKVTLNGKVLDRNYINHDEIVSGGTLHITLSDKPDKITPSKIWISEISN